MRKPKMVKFISGFVITSVIATLPSDVVFANESVDTYYDGQVIDCKECECSNRIETDKITVTRNGITFTSNPITLTKVNETIRTHEGSFSLTIATNVHVKSFGFLTSVEAVESFSAYNDNTVTFENCPTATYMRYNPNTKNLFFGSNSYTMFSKICNLSKANFTCCGYDITGNNIAITFSGGGLIANTLIATPYVELEDGNYVYGYPAHSDWNGNCYDKDVEVLTSDWEPAIDPTCTSWGYLVKKCPTCGKVMQKKMIAPKGHISSDWITVEEPSCVKEGKAVKKCLNCGTVLDENSLPKVAHSYEETVVDPTCTGKGYTKHVCSVCGDSYVDDEKDCLGHSFGDWVITKEPTCVNEGVETKTCSVCGYSENRSVSAKGHSFTDEVIAPTCHSGGYTISTCKDCGYSYKHSEVPNLEHQPSDWIVDVEPSSTMVGHKYKKCLICGDVLEEASLPVIYKPLLEIEPEVKKEEITVPTPSVKEESVPTVTPTPSVKKGAVTVPAVIKSVLALNTNEISSNPEVITFTPIIIGNTTNSPKVAGRVSTVGNPNVITPVKDKVIIEDLKSDIIYLGTYQATKSFIQPTVKLGKEYSGHWVEYYVKSGKKMKIVAVSQISDDGIVKINSSNKNQTLRMIITDSYSNVDEEPNTVHKNKSFISKILDFFKDLF